MQFPRVLTCRRHLTSQGRLQRVAFITHVLVSDHKFCYLHNVGRSGKWAIPSVIDSYKVFCLISCRISETKRRLCALEAQFFVYCEEFTCKFPWTLFTVVPTDYIQCFIELFCCDSRDSKNAIASITWSLSFITIRSLPLKSFLDFDRRTDGRTDIAKA